MPPRMKGCRAGRLGPAAPPSRFPPPDYPRGRLALCGRRLSVTPARAAGYFQPAKGIFRFLAAKAAFAVCFGLFLCWFFFFFPLGGVGEREGSLPLPPAAFPAHLPRRRDPPLPLSRPPSPAQRPPAPPPGGRPAAQPTRRGPRGSGRRGERPRRGGGYRGCRRRRPGAPSAGPRRRAVSVATARGAVGGITCGRRCRRRRCGAGPGSAGPGGGGCPGGSRSPVCVWGVPRVSFVSRVPPPPTTTGRAGRGERCTAEGTGGGAGTERAAAGSP